MCSRRKASSSVNHQLSVAVVNSLWSILTGERIGHEDDRVKEIVAGTDQFIKNENLAGPLMIFPWLRHLPFIAAKFRESKSHPMKMRQLQVRILALCPFSHSWPIFRVRNPELGFFLTLSKSPGLGISNSTCSTSISDIWRVFLLKIEKWASTI